MKTQPHLTALLLLLATACATTEPQEEDAVRDFIAVAELPQQDRISTAAHDSFELVNERFIIYAARREEYLIEFRRKCRALTERAIVADKRWGNEIRARFDTLSGCRIEKIYLLGEGQAAELKELGKTPVW